jgi:hypothetical protein
MYVSRETDPPFEVDVPRETLFFVRAKTENARFT